MKRSSILLLVYVGLITCCIQSVSGQNIPSGSGGDEGLDTSGNFQFVPIPYMSYDRSLGFSLGALPMAMYKLNKKDTVSPASISGLLGMYTTNETWFVMFFQKFFFNNDNWRIATAGGLGSINFQFFLEAPVNGYLDYNTEMDFFIIKAERKLVKNVYGGLIYQYTNFNSTLIDPEIEFSQVELHGAGISLSVDLRDDVYYPMDGSLSEIKWISFPEAFGNVVVSDKIEFEHNHYLPSRGDKDVMAMRLYTGLGIGDLSFNQQFVVGQTDIRGYTQGKFRGNYVVTAQGEYRWNLDEKICLVGFFGIASVFDAINEDHDGVLLPGAGAGFRYNVFPEYHMNIGIDFAVAKDDWGIYFRIGEAF